MATTLNLVGSGFYPGGNMSLVITTSSGATSTFYGTANSTGVVSLSIPISGIVGIMASTSLSMYAVDAYTGVQSNTVTCPVTITTEKAFLTWPQGINFNVVGSTYGQVAFAGTYNFTAAAGAASGGAPVLTTYIATDAAFTNILGTITPQMDSVFTNADGSGQENTGAHTWIMVGSPSPYKLGTVLYFILVDSVNQVASRVSVVPLSSIGNIWINAAGYYTA